MRWLLPLLSAALVALVPACACAKKDAPVTVVPADGYVPPRAGEGGGSGAASAQPGSVPAAGDDAVDAMGRIPRIPAADGREFSMSAPDAVR